MKRKTAPPSKKSPLKRVSGWVNLRWPLDKVVQWSMHEEIPGGSRFSYALGSACLFLLTIQTLTGVWQMFYYVPSVDTAYASLSYLRTEVAFGWLIHGLHYWGGTAFVIVVGLHVARVFIWGAYKKPRELVWLTGVGLLIMTAGFMFTGPVLAWDKKGYWAGKVGMTIAGSAPGLGPWMETFLQGGERMGQLTLTRFFVIHVALLPFLTVLLVLIHLVAFRVYGSTGPWDEKKRKTTGHFWPEQLFKDAVVAYFLLVLLIGLSAYFPAPISGLADPMDTRYVPKPEWNFLFLYQLLKYFSGPLEPIGTVGIPTFIILFLVSLPFIDRGPERAPAKRLFVLSCGGLMVLFIFVMTVVGYKSNPFRSIYDDERLKSVATIKQSTDKTVPQITAGVRPPGMRPTTRFDSRMPGDKLFQTLGCAECHSVAGVPTGKQGPDLLMVLEEHTSRDWLWAQLVAPETHNPYTVMPPYGHLSDENLNAIIDYLKGLSASQPERFKEDVSEQAIGGDPGFGREIFKAEGCTQCHTLTGHKTDKVGPDLLMTLGQKRTSADWLRVQLINPRRHNPNTVMPSYVRLGPKKIRSLIAYLQTIPHTGPEDLPTAPAPSIPKAPETAETQVDQSEAHQGPMQAASIVGNREHGAILFQQNCVACHGPLGKIVAPDFPVPPEGVPPLNPIRQELHDKDPGEFVRRIDPFLQHGMPNPVGGPDMPAYGDTHTLTQAQIADIEAYVLELNGVDRAEALNPGVAPKKFFNLVLIVTALLAGFSGVLAWFYRRRS